MSILEKKFWAGFFGAITLLTSYALAASADETNGGAFILTPKPGLAPRINGPLVYGCRPGNPFLYRIPCTGERPLQFSARHLPKTLSLDAASGIITGMAPAKGDYEVTFTAKSPHGSSKRTFKIIAGDGLALTPPMGWNSWYVHFIRVTDADLRAAADAMIASGMADVGYQYVNVDDGWMNAEVPRKYMPDVKRIGSLRDAKGNLLPNIFFPDMKALAEYIHSKGLKAGLYTSPGPQTCTGCGGAYQHEAQDARQFAEWGFDFLKYDWCSYGHIVNGGSPKDKNIKTFGQTGPTLEDCQRPYRLMGNLLKEQKRDIVFNLCQYGMGEVWKWGAEAGGHCWRTAGDLGFELNRIFPVALMNATHGAWSKPGAWNDPDYLQIGWIGAQKGTNFLAPHPCPLTPDEQYAFMSLWCLMAAPLFFSGDMQHLDEFTLNVLCNPEVIDVDQDPLGISATVVRLTPTTFLMVKPLADGSKAVGLCNQGETPVHVAAKWSDVGLKGRQIVRDLWRQKDLGKFADEFSADVPRHGVYLIKVKAH